MEINNQEKVWDEIAEQWGDYKQKPLKQVEEFLNQKKKGKKILDLGCGTGRNYIPGFKWYGVDFSAKMVSLAKKKPYIKVIKSNIWELGFKDKEFDYALHIAALHCIPDKEKRQKSLTELKRVLKPKARALISVWNKKAEKFAGKEKVTWLSWGERSRKKKIKRYYYLYDKQEFLKLLRKYFKTVKIHTYTKKKLDEMDKSSRRFAKRNLVVEVSKI